MHIQGNALAWYRKGNPFEKVSNPVGKIIAQVRLGNMAPLHPEDRRELFEYFQEVRENAGPVAGRESAQEDASLAMERMVQFNEQLRIEDEERSRIEDEKRKQRQRGG